MHFVTGENDSSYTSWHQIWFLDPVSHWQGFVRLCLATSIRCSYFAAKLCAAKFIAEILVLVPKYKTLYSIIFSFILPVLPLAHLYNTLIFLCIDTAFESCDLLWFH